MTNVIAYVRAAIEKRRLSALSTYAQAVVSPDLLKPKQLDQLEEILADAGRSLDQLESDIACYSRAAELKPVADLLADRQVDYEAAVQALGEYDATTAGEVAKRRVMLQMGVQSSRLKAGEAGDEYASIEQYQIARRNERITLETQRHETGRLLEESRAAARELAAIREALAAVGVEF